MMTAKMSDKDTPEDLRKVFDLQACESRGTNPVALVLPVLLEVSPLKGEGGYNPGQSSEPTYVMEEST